MSLAIRTPKMLVFLTVLILLTAIFISLAVLHSAAPNVLHTFLPWAPEIIGHNF